MAPRTIRWEELIHRLEDLEAVKVEVGIFSNGEGAQLVDGEGMTMIGLAAVHELGLGTSPRRSFIQAGVRHHADEIAKVQTRLVRKVFAGEMGAAAAGELLGQYVVGRVRAYVLEHPLDEGWANKPETIRRKESDRPLVDTGRLMSAITGRVVST